MRAAIIAWLGAAGSWSWQVGILLFVAVNVVAVAVVSVTRDRGLVNRWTNTWLGINVGLIALGAGVPVVTGLLRLAVKALPTFRPIATHLPK